MQKFNYVSEIDELLAKLEKEFPKKSNSRIMEEEEYRRIYALRDQPNAKVNETTAPIWGVTKWI